MGRLGKAANDFQFVKRGGRGHVDALSGPRLQVAEIFEFLDRLAHGDAADAVGGHQFPLGRELIVHCQLAPLDHASQKVSQLCVKRIRMVAIDRAFVW